MMDEEHHILFYTKEGCCLCDEAREILHRLRGRFSITIQEIDITTDSALYERYRNIIPVVIIDGQFSLGARIEEEDLCRYLQEGAEGFHE
ncbi:MAG: glutaredoxin family protein [Chloroflexi bacterium]|nr:glutaredoxin family protein [Chloroflexota bacterium]